MFKPQDVAAFSLSFRHHPLLFPFLIDGPGKFTPTGRGRPEVFRSDSVGKFGWSVSGTWLPLLFAFCKHPTIFQCSSAAALLSFSYLLALKTCPSFSAGATTAEADFYIH